MLLIPVGRIQDDVVEGPLAGEYRGQKDAAVVRVRLGANDGDAETVGSARQQFLDRPHSRHSVADDQKPLAAGAVAVHGRLRRARRRGSAPAAQESSCAGSTTM